jgi:hypothetical protein
MSDDVDPLPDISPRYFLERFLYALDAWRDLNNEWDGMTL